jgi:hypothetical protein
MERPNVKCIQNNGGEASLALQLLEENEMCIGKNLLRTVTNFLFSLSLAYFFCSLSRHVLSSTVRFLSALCIIFFMYVFFLCISLLPSVSFSSFRLMGYANHSLWTSTPDETHCEQNVSSQVMYEYHRSPKQPQFPNTKTNLGLRKASYWEQCRQFTSHLVSGEFPNNDTELRFQDSCGMYRVFP